MQSHLKLNLLSFQNVTSLISTNKLTVKREKTETTEQSTSVGNH